MDKLEQNVKLIAYVPVTASQLNELTSLLHENGFALDLLTTQEFYKQIKFKQMSPKA